MLLWNQIWVFFIWSGAGMLVSTRGKCFLTNNHHMKCQVVLASHCVRWSSAVCRCLRSRESVPLGDPDEHWLDPTAEQERTEEQENRKRRTGEQQPLQHVGCSRSKHLDWTDFNTTNIVWHAGRPTHPVEKTEELSDFAKKPKHWEPDVMWAKGEVWKAQMFSKSTDHIITALNGHWKGKVLGAFPLLWTRWKFWFPTQKLFQCNVFLVIEISLK